MSVVAEKHPNKITKRDGSKQDFDKDKIFNALKKCFLHVGYPEKTASSSARKLSNAVLNVIAIHSGELSVEDVQRLVIQQLWANEHFEAAEHYTIFREERKKARSDRPIDQKFVDAVEQDIKHFPTPLQHYQFISKFAKYRDSDGRRETWSECVDRVMDWFGKLPKVTLDSLEWESLRSSLYNLETSPAMRVVQMAGPALDRCNVGVYNCSYLPLKDLRAFAELLYILMQGSGVGFSVEDEYISQLPRIKKQKKLPKKHHEIEDTTEGWCDAFLLGLETWFNGEDIEYGYSKIRPAGTRLKTKGGRASGPDPLRMLLDFTRNLILSKQGKVLTDLDCHDIACMAGKIVQVGGVRRASCISLSDLLSPLMRNAKSGNWYESAVWRTMANNSAVFEEKPSSEQFMEEWLFLVKSHSGERGIFNRKAIEKGIPKRRKKIWWFGMNPCGEIILRPFQFCNLSMVVAKYDDTEQSLLRKVELATLWGCMQKTATTFGYIREEWKNNCEEEALLGVDITGQADCPLLRFGAPGRSELLRKLRDKVGEIDTKYSVRFGVNRSAADTCVKPGGNSAVLFNCGSGISAWFAIHSIRNVRESVNSPVAKFMIDEGVPYVVAPEDPSLLVFSFPRQAPEGSTTRKDLTAVQQFENWLDWKENWAEHSVSCTIYVDDHEWPELGAKVFNHFDKISGLSFLPRDNGIYQSPPNVEITREEYEQRMAAFPKLRWEKLVRYEESDQTESSMTYACSGDKCEI